MEIVRELIRISLETPVEWEREIHINNRGYISFSNSYHIGNRGGVGNVVEGVSIEEYIEDVTYDEETNMYTWDGEAYTWEDLVWEIGSCLGCYGAGYNELVDTLIEQYEKTKKKRKK
jgi:hypothetical protein